MRLKYLWALPALLLLLPGCAGQVMDGDGMVRETGYEQISTEEAERMMAQADGHIILDVRRQDEYAQGHIPGAICLPNEEIGDAPPAELTDFEQTILVYCRSGNRSKEASQKLADLGYTNVYEFGGILDWPGEIETDGRGAAATLVFDSFDGGGPEFSVTIDNPDIVVIDRVREYDDPDHDNMTGAGYRVRFTFTGQAPGEATLTVAARSPIADNFDATYAVTVDEELNVTLQQTSFVDENGAVAAVDPQPVLVVAVSGASEEIFYADPADNAAADELIERLSQEPLTVALQDYGNFEKVGDLPWELTAADEQITTGPGDIILYQGKQISIYYDENSWSLTRLATIPAVTRDELLAALGEGEAMVTFSVEWSE